MFVYSSPHSAPAPSSTSSCPLLLLLIHHQTGVSILLPCWNLHRVQLKSTTTTAVSTAQKHKTARFAVGALAFDEVSAAVEHLTKSL
ncbi:hypothetical protein F2Q69_00057431 [Brassica cretica]|uniref:Uncharacterized protein n=1 Tax=Brassica cretica TaxID=69181 RepID=A0A8S9N3K6_BRACR|nr:hypothetical protein F2Q69_00057431 [Brassica cretica]